MTSLKVDTQAVLQAADAFERLHAQAQEAIGAMDMHCKGLRPSLNMRGAWEGPAGDQMHSAYDAFVDKYCERYLQMIENYAHFLRQTAAEGYERAEVDNVNMADLIDEQVGVCPEAKPEGFTDKVLNKTRDAFYGLK